MGRLAAEYTAAGLGADTDAAPVTAESARARHRLEQAPAGKPAGQTVPAAAAESAATLKMAAGRRLQPQLVSAANCLL